MRTANLWILSRYNSSYAEIPIDCSTKRNVVMYFRKWSSNNSALLENIQSTRHMRASARTYGLAEWINNLEYNVFLPETHSNNSKRQDLAKAACLCCPSEKMFLLFYQWINSLFISLYLELKIPLTNHWNLKLELHVFTKLKLCFILSKAAKKVSLIIVKWMNCTKFSKINCIPNICLLKCR